MADVWLGGYRLVHGLLCKEIRERPKNIREIVKDAVATIAPNAPYTILHAYIVNIEDTDVIVVNVDVQQFIGLKITITNTRVCVEAKNHLDTIIDALKSIEAYMSDLTAAILDMVSELASKRG